MKKTKNKLDCDKCRFDNLQWYEYPCNKCMMDNNKFQEKICICGHTKDFHNIIDGCIYNKFNSVWCTCKKFREKK